MTSSATEAFVWIWLPGTSVPVVAGRIEKHGPLHHFTYGRSYRERDEAIALSPFELALQSGSFQPVGMNTIHSCLRDAAADAWGRRVVGYQYPDLAADELDYLLLSGSDRIGALDCQASATEYVPRESDHPTLDDLLQAAELLAEHGYGSMLFGVMFEDFLSRRLPPDDRTVIDDYLERRGWRESVPGRRYLKQLRDSTLSLYEVVEVSPGQHCDLRDHLVRGGKTFRVHEHMGTQNLVKWDRLAARVLKTDGKHLFSGGILPFPRETAQSLLRVLTESRKKFNKEVSRVTDKETANRLVASENLDELFLQDAAPEWERDNPDEHTWIWLSEPVASVWMNPFLPSTTRLQGNAPEAKRGVKKSSSG